MTIRPRGLVGLLAILVLGAAGVARADTRDVELYPHTPWLWRFSAVLGPQSYDGVARVEGEQGDFSSSLKDVADHTSFQMDVQVEGHGERLGMLFGLSYLSLYSTQEQGSSKPGLSAGILSVDALGSVGLGPWPVGTTTAGIEILGGGRLNRFDAELRPSTGAHARAGREWVDPVVGGRVTVNFDIPLRLEVRGDWGGFGVGSATDLTTRFWGAAHYRLDPVIEVFAGYRMTDIKTQHQNGNTGSSLDARVSGPMIGLTFILGG
jgi:hypothetical protein